MNVILGISAAGGIGLGQAYVLPESQERIIPKEKITLAKLSAGWKRFEVAVDKIQKHISSQLENLDKKNVQRIILETYQLMLSDPVFIEEVKTDYNKNLFNIEYTLNSKVQDYAERLRNSGNDYLAERAQDIEDVFGRVLDELLNYHPFDIDNVPDNAVIVAKSMKTSDTVIFSRKKIAGLALTEGGVTSHVAILARSYGIPCVVSLKNITKEIEHGEEVIVDGEAGEVLTCPDEKTLSEYRKKIADLEEYKLTLEKFRNKEALTKDGVHFGIYANIGTVEEAQIALDEGADGIGLFRTEFLFMNETNKLKDGGKSFTGSYSEEAQFQAYRQVLTMMGDKPVTIRTLDAGGDKILASADMPDIEEKNPLMGLRAIRLSLNYPAILRTQLRALYRASVYGNLRIMLPLITNVSQVETIKGIARGVQLQLKSEHIPFKEDVPIGVMIETAAAAVISDCLAKKCKFFSIGTNDLTQYTLGVDRENPAVAPYYNEFHLAVLRMIDFTVKNAENAKIPVSVCGEMAGRKDSVMVLAGLGVRHLSMSPKFIPMIKETLSRFTLKELQTISCRSLN